jgi:hypothetical protein
MECREEIICECGCQRDRVSSSAAGTAKRNLGIALTTTGSSDRIKTLWHRALMGYTCCA